MVIKPDWKAGLPAGARYWIYFMIGLFLLGYSWLFSIVFGAIVAIAVGVIAAWWNAKEDDIPVEKQVKPEEEVKEEPALPAKRVHFRRTGGLGRLRPIRPPRRFSWLFRRK
ncbi:MAG: hypothetical protein K6T90_21805 [Leptolyngbyaceae cyanobacterium HOT.MB2.61]|jgi:hypothetical protein|nr:hypothetical protein [Leptolyngbyaceae cyanobacterium HOT.MB2.61]